MTDAGADLVFMLVVQVALPYLLSITLVIFLAEQLRTTGIAIQAIWPHELPVAAQAALKLLAADFPRY